MKSEPVSYRGANALLAPAPHGAQTLSPRPSLSSSVRGPSKLDLTDDFAGRVLKLKLFAINRSLFCNRNMRRSSRLKQRDVNYISVDKLKNDTLALKTCREEKFITTADNSLTPAEKVVILDQGAGPISNDIDGYLMVDENELNLDKTLVVGQSFRWMRDKNSSSKWPQFAGIVGEHAFRLWRQDDDRIAFKKLNSDGTQNIPALKSFLEDYFQLKYKLKDLYEEWSEQDVNFKLCGQENRGFRILRQDPVENMFSFICATCNNIKRISQMINKMCIRFGDRLEAKPDAGQISGVASDELFFKFPSLERLVEDDVFDCLRYELGFGYRAKFITEAARMVVKKSQDNKFDCPRKYLLSLRKLTYKETCKQLQQFPGIGRKVADCICLMSMDHLDSIPVDCHIYEVFCRNYMPRLREERKSLTPAVHDLIGTYFTDMFGPLAGWSTSVLFVGELKHLDKDSSIQKLLEKNWGKKSKSSANTLNEPKQKKTKREK